MSKKLIDELLKNSSNIKVKDIKGNITKPITGDKWKVEVEGEFKDMSRKMTIEDLSKTVTDLSKTVTDLSKTVQKGFEAINSRLDNIETRLENVEQDIRDIKNTPTMKRELKK